MGKEGKLTSRDKTALALKEGLGTIRVLCVGVSKYLAKAGFPDLRQCDHDAASISSAFLDIPQLNANPDHVVLMNAQTSDRLPSRGNILDQLHELKSACDENERLLFYFSGHGHRIAGIDDHFLVPGDAYSEAAPEALISMKEVIGILTGSAARQKIVVLDACLSGPTLLGSKLHAASYSDKFFAKYLKSATGLVVLSSSAANQASYTKSDNPKLSLFTQYFSKALRGETKALDDRILTIPALFNYVSTEVLRKNGEYRIQQTPSIESTANSTLVLADFRKPIVSHATGSLKNHFVENLVFRDVTSERTSAILTEWKDRTKSAEQLEFAANSLGAMEAYLANDFGTWRPLLRRQFAFTSSDIDTTGNQLTFPGGSLSYKYEAIAKDRGEIRRKLQLDIDWFSDGPRLLLLLTMFGFKPRKIEFKLGTSIAPLEQIAGLEANEWIIGTESEEKLIATKGEVEITVRQRSIAVDGYDLKAILSDGRSGSKSKKGLIDTIAAIAPAKSEE